MSTTTTYLLEIGCEELPTSSLEQLRDALVSGFESALSAEHVAFATIRSIAAPRRLGVVIEELALSTQPKALFKRGPAVTQAYKDGQPTGALLGFCKGLGISPEEVSVEETEKGAWVAYQTIQPGQPIADRLPQITQQVIAQLPLSKPMRWGSGRAVFPRPVHWLVALLGSDVISFEVFGVATDRYSFGHRVHSPARITLQHASEYLDTLRSHYVLAEFNERKALTWKKIQEVAQAHDLTVHEDDPLLREITCLIEWPVPLVGQFDEGFLNVPEIALIAAMRGHQKYFHTRQSSGALSNHFITVANIESLEPNQVIAGNQRVIRARLSDARFFYETDRKTPLVSRRESLDRIAFQPGLGSLGDKTERVRILSREISSSLSLNAQLADRAALLSRCDLVSEMVLEFDELQGQIGGIYAREDGEHPEIADALSTLYRPAGPTDMPPGSILGCVLGLADRLDTLAGLFAIGQPPTGSKDPFGLRRAMLALLRINAEPGIRIDLGPWLERAIALQPVNSDPSVIEQLLGFLRDRERGLLLDEGLPHDHIAAAQGASDVNTYLTRLRAQALFRSRSNPAFASLIASNKRITNILGKHDGAVSPVMTKLLREPAERSLADALRDIQPEINNAVSRENYDTALEVAASIAPTLDTFFNDVLVNDPDSAIRANRYSLLSAIRNALLALGDLSEVQA